MFVIRGAQSFCTRVFAEIFYVLVDENFRILLVEFIGLSESLHNDPFKISLAGLHSNLLQMDNLRTHVRRKHLPSIFSKRLKLIQQNIILDLCNQIKTRIIILIGNSSVVEVLHYWSYRCIDLSSPDTQQGNIQLLSYVEGLDYS